MLEKASAMILAEMEKGDRAARPTVTQIGASE
jgi:hypothetical protein